MWLYEHREQLGEFQRFAEIAYFLTFGIPYDDKDDVGQDIVLALKKEADKHNGKGDNYLWGIGRNIVRQYWYKKYRDRRIFCPLHENNRGEWAMVANVAKFISDDGDGDAQLDALATLNTLPPRLKAIGYKRLNGESLSKAESWYWAKEKKKLNCRHHTNELSDWEKRRVIELHRKGLPVKTIAKTLGRSCVAVDMCLVKARLREAPPWMTKHFEIRNGSIGKSQIRLERERAERRQRRPEKGGAAGIV
jgi:DNA-directed RNA polymerase specialized sigma24 family protein